MDPHTQRGHSLGLQDCYFRTIIALKSASQSFISSWHISSLNSVLDSPRLALCIMSTPPFGPAVSLLPCLLMLCSDKGKEANPGSEAHKLSQLSSFALLSANISSNTLLGWRYGHQRAGWYVWPLRNYSAPCLLNLCLWSYWTCQHMCKWSFPIARSS